jgi:hypothetical protein
VVGVRSSRSAWSVLSWCSLGSALSVASVGSALSFGSALSVDRWPPQGPRGPSCRSGRAARSCRSGRVARSCRSGRLARSCRSATPEGPAGVVRPTTRRRPRGPSAPCWRSPASWGLRTACAAAGRRVGPGAAVISQARAFRAGSLSKDATLRASSAAVATPWQPCGMALAACSASAWGRTIADA